MTYNIFHLLVLIPDLALLFPTGCLLLLAEYFLFQICVLVPTLIYFPYPHFCAGIGPCLQFLQSPYFETHFSQWGNRQTDRMNPSCSTYGLNPGPSFCEMTELVIIVLCYSHSV